MKKQNKKPENKQQKTSFSPKIIVGVLLAVFVGISLFFRIALPFDKVFVGDWIKFTCNDAYYHMRIVDNLVHNFPHLTFFNPYFIHPSGGVVGGAHFFDWLLSGIIWVIGLGAPTQHTIDIIGVYFPAVLGALVVIPIYFIGKTLFNKWAGVGSALMIAIAPGEIMGRSILGSTDHHIAEVLFSAIAVMFLLLAIKRTGIQPIIYSVLAGVFVGVYLLTWTGGLLLLFIICLFFISQIIINHMQGKESLWLGNIALQVALVATALNYGQILSGEIKLAMYLALVVPLLLSTISWLMLERKIKPIWYLASIIGLGVGAVGVLYLIMPANVMGMVSSFNAFSHTGATATTTLELQPIFFPQGKFDLSIVWGNFGMSLLVFPVALMVMGWMFYKGKCKEQGWLLFLIWTTVMVILTLMQRRYAYYLAVNVAVLVGFLAYETIKKALPKFKVKKHADFAIRYANVIIVAIIIVMAVIVPNFVMATTSAKSAPFSPSDDWEESLSWMKDNTPLPFQGADLYDESYGINPNNLPAEWGYERWGYPKADYGVTAWWDYGYWITRIAHRVPSANPAQNPVPIKKVAELLLTQDGVADEAMMSDLDSKYIVLDSSMASYKFYAMPTWAGEPYEKYLGFYYAQNGNQFQQVMLLYPEYYQTLCSRLYNFDGQAVIEQKPMVITYEDRTTDSGESARVITSNREFATYIEALNYLATLKSDKARIVGVSPTQSPISLEALENYKLIHTSPAKEIKIFEYDKNEN